MIYLKTYLLEINTKLCNGYNRMSIKVKITF